MLNRVAQGGFTLVELMVTITVMVLLSLLAVPSMSQYVQNSRIHGNAEMMLASLQKARTEAIRRNAVVELVFTDHTPDASSTETNGVNTSGPNWLVRQVPATATDTHVFIEGKSGAESGGATGSLNGFSANASAVSFNPYGALSTGSGVRILFKPPVGECMPAGSARCLQLVVARGGQSRLCDPAVTTANDTRKC